MVTIEVDESYAFDFLSIAWVKKIKKLKNADEQFFFYFENIKYQIGSDLFYEIIESSEYNSLIHYNERIYEKLEEIRCNNCIVSAKIIDDLNTCRYHSKVKLQKSFFGKDIKEIKSDMMT
tara:strand:+ start:20158 stop:20517 length:360 start_codon:yes stop_codon:yes gene_type:complete